MKKDNRRSYERYEYEAPLQYAYVDKEKYYESKMYNYSSGGMYFESKYPVLAGSQIYINMVNYSPTGYGPDAYQTYQGKATRCSEYKDQGTPYYGVGVEYNEPVKYAL